jgi:predicted  nucleic acid-binding Zn-ribbon protein
LKKKKLENGTRVEAESFEKGKEIFILTDDEKVAMPVGEYLLEDGRLIVVAQEGIIDDVREVSNEVPQKEEEPASVTEDLSEEDDKKKDEKKKEEKMADVGDWEGMEKRIQNLEDAIADIKSRLGEKEMEDQEVEDSIKKIKEELSMPSASPIRHNPEGSVKKSHFKLSPQRKKSTMDYILNQLNK